MLHRLRRACQLRFRRTLQDPALGIRPLLDAESQFPTNERRNSVKEEEVMRRGRACRPISMTSSNPDVVISATRAPFLWSRALVPTVVPCSSVRAAPAPGLRLVGRIFQSFGDCARGSSSVEETFRVFRAALNPHAIGGNVPPVSIAIRSADCDARAMGANDEQGRLPPLAAKAEPHNRDTERRKTFKSTKPKVLVGAFKSFRFLCGSVSIFAREGQSQPL